MFEAWEDDRRGLRRGEDQDDRRRLHGRRRIAQSRPNPVLSCVQLGLRMIEFTRSLTDDQGTSLGLDLRVGIHVGPVVSGVLGRRQSLFDLWGDTVNLASRWRATATPAA